MRATVPTPKQGSGCFDYTLIEAAKLNGVNIQASMLGTGLDLNFVKELPQLTKLAISESRDLDLAPVAKIDLRPKFPPALRGVLGVKSLALGRHLVHCLSLQKFHRCQVAQC